MQHLDEGTIHAWLDGALPNDEQMLIEQHIRQCADCATLVADARGMIAGATRIVSALDNVPGGVIPAKREVGPTKAQASMWRSLRLTPFRAGLAATLMIAVASMFAVRHDPTNKFVVPVAQTRLDDRPAAAPTPAPPVAPEEAAPIPAPVAVRSADASAIKPAKSKDLVQASVAQPRRDTLVVPAATSGVAASPPTNAARDDANRIDSAQAKAAAPALQPPTGNIKALQSAATSEARVREALDSATRGARAQDSLNSGRGAIARRSGAFTSAAGSAPMQLQEVVVTSATLTQSAAPFVGCYRMLRDSIAPLLAVPERFGLDRTSSLSVTRYVVRSVGPTGDMDTVLTSATWQSTSRGAATVTWTAGSAPVTLRLALASTGVTANATVDGSSRPLQLARLVCGR